MIKVIDTSPVLPQYFSWVEMDSSLSLERFTVKTTNPSSFLQGLNKVVSFRRL